MTRSLFQVGIFFLFLCLLAGCGDGRKGPPLIFVKGTVQLDGQPLADGAIHFVSPGVMPAALLINNKGEFSGKIPIEPGEKKVEIYAFKEAKAVTFPPPENPGKENYLPARFNAKSELKAEIKKEGPNDFNFKVETK